MEVFVPYENKKIDLEKHLFDTLTQHSQKTPYWQEKLTPKKIDEIITSDLKQTLYNLSQLEVDQNLLRTNWQYFKPRDLKNTKVSFSSGTTGPQKQCEWSRDYLETQINYLAHYISKQGIKVKSAIIQGPTSVFKDVNEGLVDKLGGTPYFIPIRVEGIKPIIESAANKGQEELIRVLKEYFAPEIEKTRTYLEHDDNVNFMRSASMMLMPFEAFFGDKRNIETVMVSGTNYTPQTHEMLMKKFGKVVPSYGYFAFGDALGKYSNENLDYYTPFPNAIATVMKDDGEIAKYGEEGHPLFVIARKDLLLVLKEKNESVKRVPQTEEFPWDGIRNPHRNTPQITV
jgi:hypothetical protein